MTNDENARFVKSNNYRYKQLLKERLQNKKLTTHIDGIVRKMKDDGESQTSMDPIINLATVLKYQHQDFNVSDSDDSSENTTSS